MQLRCLIVTLCCVANTSFAQTVLQGDHKILGTLFVGRTGTDSKNNTMRILPMTSNTSANSVIECYESSDVNNSAYVAIGVAVDNWGAPVRGAVIASRANGSVSPRDLYFSAQEGYNINAPALVIKSAENNVGIKTNRIPAGFALAVGGNVLVESIKVSVVSLWPDYVFEQGYKLPSLQELDQYITTHKHLPDMPAAAEVKKEGVDLGEMNRKLLQKIEEQTLYIIQLNKRMDEMTARLMLVEVPRKE